VALSSLTTPPPQAPRRRQGAAGRPGPGPPGSWPSHRSPAAGAGQAPGQEVGRAHRRRHTAAATGCRRGPPDLLPVGLVDHPAAAPGRGGWPAAAGWAQRPDRDLGRGDAQLELAARAHLAPRHRVVAGRKAGQGVLADPAAVPVADHIGLLGQRTQRRPVPVGPDRDDLAVGAAHLGAPDRQPGGERGVQLGQLGEHAAGEHVAAHDLDLTLHPPLGLGAVRTASQIVKL
jgi:hypothetical protein